MCRFGALGVFCERHKQDASDLSLRDALTQAGWPVPSEQTPLERTLEFFVVDWDFEFPPEHVSIYNYFAVGKADSYHNLCNQSMATTTTRSTPGRMPNARTAARLGMLGGFPWESPRYFVTDKRGFAAVAEHVAGSFHGPNVSHSKVRIVHSVPVFLVALQAIDKKLRATQLFILIEFSLATQTLACHPCGPHTTLS